MDRIDTDTSLIDLRFRGRSYIATALLEGDGPALVDPGPTSTLPRLRAELASRGLGIGDLGALLLTHIHLDHAGATGVLVRENPALRVYVHERGARHLIDPSRLLESARRLYGDAMDPLWGEVAAVPVGNVVALRGDERIHAARRDLDVAYTPGHAWHHMSFLDPSTGIAYVGDAAGIRLSGRPYVLPPTPPPDIDLAAWAESLARISDWRPERLFVTHFGAVDDVAAHLSELETRLAAWADDVRESLAEPGDDADRAYRFVERVGQDMRRHLADDDVAEYEANGGIEASWHGLARYWRKRRGS